MGIRSENTFVVARSHNKIDFTVHTSVIFTAVGDGKAAEKKKMGKYRVTDVYEFVGWTGREGMANEAEAEQFGKLFWQI